VAVNAGEDGDAALSAALHHPSLQGPSRLAERVRVAAALGFACGSTGPAALRQVLAEDKIARDLRCASLLAIAKRIGPEATPDLLEGLAFPDGAVKDYAVIALACAGDDGAWDAVLARLVVLLRRTTARQSDGSDVVVALAYLGHYAVTSERTAKVRYVVQKKWDRLQESDRSWVRTYWPAHASPDCNPSPLAQRERSELRRWARQHLPWLPPPRWAGA
jgi:hypothetical protein